MLHQSRQTDTPLQEGLPPGSSLLEGQYHIERVIRAGGFGVTYIARDSLERQVVVKECFPAGFCRRLGTEVAAQSPLQKKSYRNVLRHFLREAQWLERARHQNIVSVHQVFKENSTAYIAMDYVQGCDLHDLRHEQAVRVSPQLVRHIATQMLQALQSLHDKAILHRDIAPDNILIDKLDQVMLIDFGAACSLEDGQDTALSAILSVKDGYSAHELYRPNIAHRPACDIYALGATLYFLVTGETPVSSVKRLDAVTAGAEDPMALLAEGDWPYETAFLETIDKALSILPGARYQSAAEWCASLPEPLHRPVQTEEPQVHSASAVSATAGIESAIADLVSASEATVLNPRVHPAAAPVLPVQDAPRQVVDLFGNPISDIDTWLEDQDRLARAKASQPLQQDLSPEVTRSPPRLQQSASVQPAASSRPEKRSLLHRVGGLFFGFSRRTTRDDYGDWA